MEVQEADKKPFWQSLTVQGQAVSAVGFAWLFLDLLVKPAEMLISGGRVRFAELIPSAVMVTLGAIASLTGRFRKGDLVVRKKKIPPNITGDYAPVRSPAANYSAEDMRRVNLRRDTAANTSAVYTANPLDPMNTLLIDEALSGDGDRKKQNSDIDNSGNDSSTDGGSDVSVDKNSSHEPSSTSSDQGDSNPGTNLNDSSSSNVSSSSDSSSSSSPGFDSSGFDSSGFDSSGFDSTGF